VGTLVKKRVAMGLENEGLRALSWDRHVSRRRAPIADEIRRGIAAGEVDASVDVEAMIDLINGLYYYQFVVRAPSDPEEARARIRAAVRLVFRGASSAA
jgi:predicted amino acid dehydrogenase